MVIKEYINKEDWAMFVKDHPNGNIFQTPEMYEVYKETKNIEPIVLVVLNEDDNILGILLAAIHKEYSGLLGILTSRSIIIGGPIIKDNDKNALKFLLEAYLNKIKNKVIFSQFRNLWDWNSLKDIFIEKEFEYDRHLDIFIDLLPDEEQLWANINSKARNKVRKANKSGVMFKVIEPSDYIIQESYHILLKVYENAKIPLADISLFSNSFKVLSKRNMIKLFCAIKDDKIIGVRIGLLYKDIVYDWYAGSLSKFYKFNPNDFLPFNILVWGHNNNFKLFDFGGAGKPGVPYGVRDHKMKFGGRLVEFGRFEKIHKPLLMRVVNIGLKIYKFIR